MQIDLLKPGNPNYKEINHTTWTPVSLLYSSNYSKRYMIGIMAKRKYFHLHIIQQSDNKITTKRSHCLNSY